ncbi:MAG: hypothetical protein GX251_11510 [Firmicutes bacterium]|nr:hypothetical protein [Bacillota bacterium]
MQLFSTLLNKPKLTLMYSLPQNDPKLAKAALAGGIDVLKVHTNVSHRASGTHFGSLEDERDNLQQILDLSDGRPVGIVPAGQGVITCADLEPLKEMGFAFASAYAHHFAPGVFDFPGLEVMVAPDYTYQVWELQNWRELGVDVIEASIIEPAGYGEPLSFRDISKYRALKELGLPVVVPTQRKVTPADISSLIKAGVNGLMLGAVVTGKDPREIEKIIQEFRRALDEVY